MEGDKPKIATGRGWRITHRVMASLILLGVILSATLTEIIREYNYSREWRSPAESIIYDVVTMGSSRDRISPYDELFRDASMRYGNHWCLMCAIGYVESRFRPKAQSYAGAIGLMQIMPRTGRHYGVSVDDLFDVKINIDLAYRHYNDIERMLDIPDSVAMRDRISLVLAGYNGGVGRVFDSQRLTRKSGGDPHRWRDVAPNMLRLRYAEGYADSLVRFGRFRAAAYTVRYVDDVLDKYDEYRRNTTHSASYFYPNALLWD